MTTSERELVVKGLSTVPAPPPYLWGPYQQPLQQLMLLTNGPMYACFNQQLLPPDHGIVANYYLIDWTPSTSSRYQCFRWHDDIDPLDLVFRDFTKSLLELTSAGDVVTTGDIVSPALV